MLVLWNWGKNPTPDRWNFMPWQKLLFPCTYLLSPVHKFHFTNGICIPGSKLEFYTTHTHPKNIFSPVYIPRPFSGPLVPMGGIGTEEASLHWPPSGTRLEAKSVTLEEAVWWLQVEYQVAQRWVRVEKSRHKAGKPLEALQRPTLQFTLLPLSGWETAGFHAVADHRRPYGGPLVLCRVHVPTTSLEEMKWIQRYWPCL